MPPTPCAHCGFNFMKPHPSSETKLCHNCEIREKIRNPQPKEKMEEVIILIKCPKEIHAKIEEYCINKGLDLSKYFLDLHSKWFNLDNDSINDIINTKTNNIKTKKEQKV